MLAEVRRRLDGGLNAQERRAVVQLLVKRITIHTTVGERGKKEAKAVIQYRFDPGVVVTAADTRASRNYTHLQRVLTL